MFNLNSLASNIKKYRRARNFSQSDFAAAIGVTPQSVSKWECGSSAPDIENLCLISQILGISPDMLLEHCSEQKKLMIGIDGGGTKTEFVLFNEDGKIIDRKLLGACNPNTIGTDGSIAVLTEGINGFLASSPGICGAYIGAAGLMLGNHLDRIFSELKKAYPFLKIKLSSDLFNIAAGALEDDRCCITAISGTGSSVLVKDGEELTRFSGYGYLLSRAGSGYDIGRDAVYAAISHMDGMGKPTAITDLIKENFGESVSDIIEKIYRENAAFTASAASLVFDAYRNGDAVAAEIIERNADSLADTVNFAHSRFRHIKTVIMSGSIITKNEDFQVLVNRRLSPDLKTIVPKAPPVIGACVLCSRLCGVSTDGLVEKLTKEYCERI